MQALKTTGLVVLGTIAAFTALDALFTAMLMLGVPTGMAD